ncbi:right-handed parallel beta-helix repeat-containing protein [Massilia sp. PAMC28688]|uniref:right-handed parallel beta-helix repeat-containing protein n=1 Tax=Massilia sp. PAMC28688 TaxID=2861283 RepID=UPI001C62D0DB|nr:right-handed parallel beta-helix repeat-containing protein [Massilia sp. PAMC28688]QYF95074.1 right-handed parallel beta-helix repeat-containing protein [Massilia sp. PAMC28688]
MVRGARPARWRVVALVVAVLSLLAAGAVVLLLQERGITPRALAPYLAKRSSGHNDIIVGTGQWSAALLERLDRGPAGPRQLDLPVLGAQSSPAPASGTVRIVTSGGELRRAMAHAAPGDIITIAPGSYRIGGPPIVANRAGTAAANIVVRAEKAGSVELELAIGEGFVVLAPHWRFENLTIRGVCKPQLYCEHAFHVVGAASHFTAINNAIIDYNAHFKVNGNKRQYPDYGRIENNTLRNDSIRHTVKSVTPVDIVAASHWLIRRNVITDFIKGQGDRISYAAFTKGGGSANVFEQNLVVCEARLRGAPGQRVGISLGGGATGQAYCRDGKCITEQDRSIVRANIIASCSDDGIYLNNAAASRVIHNTLVDTGGIHVRFAGSSADIEGNLVDGQIRARNGAVVRLHDNLVTPIAQQYLGIHPQRRLYMDADALDLRWNGQAPRRQDAGQLPPDLCGVTRPAHPAYGAVEDISACMAAD